MFQMLGNSGLGNNQQFESGLGGIEEDVEYKRNGFNDGGISGINELGGFNGGNSMRNGYQNGYRPLGQVVDDEKYDDRNRDTDDEQGDDEDQDDDDFVRMNTLLGSTGLSKYTMEFMSNGIKTKEQLMNVPTEFVSFIIPDMKDQERFFE